MKINCYDETGKSFESKYSEAEVEFLLLFARLYKNGKINSETFQHVYLDYDDWFNEIGLIYEEGIGVEQDFTEANYWYQQALNYGDDYLAACNLADNLRKGRGIEKDLERAFKTFCLTSHPYALFRIGEAYEHGWGTQQDLNLAHYFYLRSALAGHRLGCKRCDELKLDYRTLSGILGDDEENDEDDE